LKKLAKGVLLPVDERTELREKDAVSGMEPKNEQKTEPSPRATISWLESVFLPQAVKIYQNFILKIDKKSTNKILKLTKSFSNGHLFQYSNDRDQSQTCSQIAQNVPKSDRFCLIIS
jgi:hypothetical protein